MKKIAVFIILVSLSLYGSAQTTTLTTVSDEVNTGSVNEFGEAIYEREVKIETKDFEVQNHWSRFKDSNNLSSQYDTISRTGKFKISVSATNACTLDPDLDPSGCSGQKPFLINNEAVDGVNSGEILSLAFQPAKDEEGNIYSSTSDNIFYPLDVNRSLETTNDSENGGDIGSGKKTFFSFFSSLFNFMYDNTIGRLFLKQEYIADEKYEERSEAAQNRRARYIGNIIAGVEQDNRLKMGESQTVIKQTINTPVSLLHYAEAVRTTEEEQCKLMFINLNPDGLMCRVMSGFGMDIWMPFFNKSKITKIEANYIMLDTENSLLAMANGLDENGIPFFRDIGGDDDDKLSFLQKMLKPMLTMMDMMKNIMFGSSKAEIVANPVEREYLFDEDKAMTLTFAVTEDGTAVDSFANFKMLKLRSVYGDSLNSCRVKKSPGMLSWSHWETTFYEDVEDSENGPEGSMDNSEWIEWCQTTGDKKGMFDYLFDWSSGGFFNPINWMQSIMNSMITIIFGSYTIEDLSSSISRGLILDLKKVDLESSYPLNSQKIEVIYVK